LPQLRASALQVPEHFGDIVVVDEKFVTAATGGPGGARLDDQRRRVDGSALRPRVDGIISDVPSVLAGCWRNGTQLAAGGSPGAEGLG